MSETVKEKKIRSAAPSPYLFRGNLDAVLYLIVYLGLPLYSVLNYINLGDAAILFTALSCCVGVIYDCCSRYGGDCGRFKVTKIWIIGFTNGGLLIYIAASIQSYLSKGVMLCPYVYILLAVAPAVGVNDFILMARDDVRARR